MEITASHPHHTAAKPRADLHDPSYQAYQILHWGFVAAPFLAGLDKFFGLLADWQGYLAPAFARLSPLGASATMRVVGVVEMLAAVVVAVRPRIGAYVVAAWLACIMLNLVILGHGYDVALRDLGLFLAALALGRLSALHDHKPVA
jgi:hypothetical protein